MRILSCEVLVSAGQQQKIAKCIGLRTHRPRSAPAVQSPPMSFKSSHHASPNARYVAPTTPPSTNAVLPLRRSQGLQQPQPCRTNVVENSSADNLIDPIRRNARKACIDGTHASNECPSQRPDAEHHTMIHRKAMVKKPSRMRKPRASQRSGPPQDSSWVPIELICGPMWRCPARCSGSVSNTAPRTHSTGSSRLRLRVLRPGGPHLETSEALTCRRFLSAQPGRAQERRAGPRRQTAPSHRLLVNREHLLLDRSLAWDADLCFRFAGKEATPRTPLNAKGGHAYSQRK